MRMRLLICLLLSLGLAGCHSPFKKKDKEDPASNLKIKDDDTNFRAFIGRLRIAVEKKDLAMLSSMMSPNFGYRWDTPPEGEDAFQYWDQNRLWGELRDVLKDRFVAHEDFMVAPQPVPNYTGYRAGMRAVNGTWKFAYFVGPEPQ